MFTVNQPNVSHPGTIANLIAKIRVALETFRAAIDATKKADDAAQDAENARLAAHDNLEHATMDLQEFTDRTQATVGQITKQSECLMLRSTDDPSTARFHAERVEGWIARLDSAMQAAVDSPPIHLYRVNLVAPVAFALNVYAESQVDAERSALATSASSLRRAIEERTDGFRPLPSPTGRFALIGEPVAIREEEADYLSPATQGAVHDFDAPPEAPSLAEATASLAQAAITLDGAPAPRGWQNIEA